MNVHNGGSITQQHGLDKSRTSQISASGPFVPAEMKRRDKIPRTPIDPVLLDQIRRDNVRIYK